MEISNAFATIARVEMLGFAMVREKMEGGCGENR